MVHAHLSLRKKKSETNVIYKSHVFLLLLQHSNLSECVGLRKIRQLQMNHDNGWKTKDVLHPKASLGLSQASQQYSVWSVQTCMQSWKSIQMVDYKAEKRDIATIRSREQYKGRHLGMWIESQQKCHTPI